MALCVTMDTRVEVIVQIQMENKEGSHAAEK